MHATDMNKIKRIFHDLTHHAYLVVGEPVAVLPELKQALCEKIGFANLEADPDFWERSFETFGIKDAHHLRELQQKKAFGKHGRFFVFSVGVMTIEAQNSLLKTFEEPSADTHFFLIARSEDIFLPTLKSRCQILNQAVMPVQAGENFLIKEFLGLEPQERLDFTRDKFTKNKDATKSDMMDFLSELEKEIYVKMKDGGKNSGHLALQAIMTAREYLLLPRSSTRLIMEHVALVV